MVVRTPTLQIALQISAIISPEYMLHLNKKLNWTRSLEKCNFQFQHYYDLEIRPATGAGMNG